MKVLAEQKFTQPPAQFSEATLVKALEENGIGRPSTYATILSVLTDRDYVDKLEGRFRPTQLGTLVNGMLQTGFHDIINEGYTAALEEQLDQIEDGKIAWKQAVADFDVKFTKDLETAGEQMPNVKKDGIPLDEKCPDCGAGLVMRFGRFGAVHRLQQLPGVQVQPQRRRGRGDAAPAAAQRRRPRRRSRPARCAASRWRSSAAASAPSTAAPAIRSARTSARPAPSRRRRCRPASPARSAARARSSRRSSHRGKTFWSCNRYPDCKFSLWKKPVIRDCPQCNATFLLEKVTKKHGPSTSATPKGAATSRTPSRSKRRPDGSSRACGVAPQDSAAALRLAALRSNLDAAAASLRRAVPFQP